MKEVNYMYQNTLAKRNEIGMNSLVHTSKLYFTLVVLVFLLILLGFFSVHQAHEINKKVIKQYNQELIPIDVLGDIKSSLYRIRGRVIRHIDEPDNQQVHENKISEQISRIGKKDKLYQRTRLSEEELEYLLIYKKSKDKYISLINNTVLPLSRSGEIEKAKDVFYGAAMNEFYGIREGINLLIEYQINRALLRGKESKSSYLIMELIVLSIITLVLILASILYVYKIRTRLSNDLSEAILQHSTHGVIITDNKLKIKWVNPAFEKTTGYSAEYIFNKTPSILRSNYHDSNFYEELWGTLKKSGTWEGEIWNKKSTGEIYPEWLNIIVLRDVRGRIQQYAGVFADLSQLKKAEDKLHKLAYFDSITGFGNVSMLNATIDNIVNGYHPKISNIIIILLDLDHFHDINTGIGRQAGDAVLKELATRLKGLREDVSEYRTGADEFAITFTKSESDEEMHNYIHNLIVDIKNKLSKKFIFKQYELNLSCSIGVACEPLKSLNSGDILRKASSALAYCKKYSRSSYQFYNIGIDNKTKYLHELSLSISSAIDKNEFYLVFQPQVNRLRKVIGAETLLRWNSKKHGEITPDVFINIAEEQGLMISIGRWVFNNALKQLSDWNDEGLYNEEFRLAINVSPQQLLDRNIVDDFYESCIFYNIKPENIEIEITETSIGGNSSYIYKNLYALSVKGFKISIDDFGTGHSSLSRLRDFPINTLKIDRVFVKNMCSSTSDEALIKSIIDMAHILGFKVVAEGVEDESHISMLLKFNCDIFQGFYFSKPINHFDFIKYKKLNDLASHA